MELWSGYSVEPGSRWSVVSRLETEMTVFDTCWNRRKICDVLVGLKLRGGSVPGTLSGLVPYPVHRITRAAGQTSGSRSDHWKDDP
jgi:hypothetical protein